MTNNTPTRTPTGLIATWQRISPSLVPVLAVLTALITTIPFMVITSGRGDVGSGLNTAFTAYAAFIEGSTGIVINQMLKTDDVAIAQQLADQSDLNNTQLRQLAVRVNSLTEMGAENVIRDAEVIRRYEGKLDAAEIETLGEYTPHIREIGADKLREMSPLIEAMDDALTSTEALNLAREYGAETNLTPKHREALAALLPITDSYGDTELINYLSIIATKNGVANIKRYQQQLAVLDRLALAANDSDVFSFESISAAKTPVQSGAQVILDLADVHTQLQNAGIENTGLLSKQLNLVNSLYGSRVLSDTDVANALANELPPYLANNFVVYRPGNQPLLIDPGETGTTGIIYRNNAPDKPDTVYLRMGDHALLFMPGNLERTLTRAIPFIIAGLAVAFGFKGGLFNIGAEGQLYMGGLIAAWLGFSPLFDGLPAILRVLLVLVGGIIGGGFWGMIPGILKAFTGAHEVINTIMLNFIAIRFVDWIIRSERPIILRDPTASVPRTPLVAETARLPRFADLGVGWIVAAAVLVLVFMLWQRRKTLGKAPQQMIRPILYAVLTFLGGVFLTWLNVNNELHIGLALMILTVWFIDWFLARTTIGFEIQTVGTNPDAAHYAGMSVKWMTVLAITISGMLTGLAGAIEISSVQYSMQPAFFAGLGFDAIAVALLARKNPKNMIVAGLLWAALLVGAPLMQLRADLAIDLVKIIQALIIMFIAADAIIRYLWRIPAAKADEQSAMFSKGWGG